ncbi:MAG TPA: hypothetical protein VMR17_19730 [Xanthobacteraceae bacterium]|jgi:hypothetical protein|nr:hypothetical protein [Xanthobacteraceae bacterium]
MADAAAGGEPHSETAPPDASSYFARARTHALDLASTLILFFCASISTGRVWRFAFDDEIYTLTRTQMRSVFKVFPKNSEMLFYGLHHLGLSEPQMRLCSLAMTGLALVLFQLLALTWIAQRHRPDGLLPVRLIAVLVFALIPLAIGQGDALRWYPPFALLIALFVTLYLAGNGAARLCSGLVLGLAGSTNIIAALIVPPFMLYRYGLQRRFCWSFDLPFWLLAGLGGSVGFYSAYLLSAQHLELARSFFGIGAVQSVLMDTLGFFGGYALGVGQAWIVVPAVIISAAAAWSAIDRTQPGKPAHLLLLMLSVSALAALAGIAEPRAFLFLAPMVGVLLVLFFDRQIRGGHAARTLILVTLVLTTSVAAIANVNFGAHPFKRNLAIPYQSILDFIADNEKGHVLVVSTDSVIPWLLEHAGGDRCIDFFFKVRRCLAPAQRFDSIFIISGHSSDDTDEATMRQFQSFLADITAGRSKVATMGAGIDEDAALKSRLTGIHLDRTILTVDYYQ